MDVTTLGHYTHNISGGVLMQGSVQASTNMQHYVPGMQQVHNIMVPTIKHLHNQMNQMIMSMMNIK